MPCFGQGWNWRDEIGRDQEEAGGGAGALEARARGFRPAAAGRRRRLPPLRLRPVLDRQPLAEIVGVRYAAVSSPESIRFPLGKKSRGVLTLVVEGAHAPMMQHVAPTIVERVNALLRLSGGGAGRVPPGHRPGGQSRGRGRRRRRCGRSRPSWANSLREVADPELRACLESLARGLADGEGAPVVTTIPVVGKIGGEKKK